MKYSEIRMDLFKTDESFALAHCVSADCAMGAGIAKEFVLRFPKIKNRVKEKNPQIGDAVTHYSNNRLIFNLITKDKYWHKPTYKTFTAAVEDLKDAVEKLNVNKLAIPLLGSGLDKLDWSVNREIIKEVFVDVDIEILVCIKE